MLFFFNVFFLGQNDQKFEECQGPCRHTDVFDPEITLLSDPMAPIAPLVKPQI